MAKEKIIFISVVLIAVFLRVINLGQSLWLDEAAQALMSSSGIRSILIERSGDFHPPLFYLLSHFWMLISTKTEWLRILPVTFGVLNIFAIYKLSKILYPGKKVKILSFEISIENLSAFILAISPFHIYYSQEFRSYSLLCLLGTISFIPLLQKKFFRLGLIWSLLMYTHYSSVFLILAQIIYVISYDRKIIKKTILSIVTALVLYIPWSGQFYNQVFSGLNISQQIPGWSSVLSLSPIKATPQIFFKIIAGRINIYPKNIYYVYVFIVLTIFIIASILVSNKQKLLYIWIFTPVLLMIITSFVFPQTQPFRLIYILPGIVFLFIEAIFKSPKTFLILILYISVFGNLMYYTRPRLQREDWISLTQLINTSPIPTVVKFPDAFAPIKWYLPNAKIINTGPIPVDESVFELSIQKANPQKLYLLEYLGELTDPGRVTESVLSKQGYSVKNTYNIEGVGLVYLYSK